MAAFRRATDLEAVLQERHYREPFGAPTGLAVVPCTRGKEGRCVPSRPVGAGSYSAPERPPLRPVLAKFRQGPEGDRRSRGGRRDGPGADWHAYPLIPIKRTEFVDASIGLAADSYKPIEEGIKWPTPP
jgi:hypothetical protein